MTFYADLHVHSKHSRATSRDGDLEHMAFWARKKGVSVLGTGDFTHPEWFGELQEKLVPAEPGLYRLRADLEKQVDQWLDGPGHQPKVGPGPVRFVLQVEISTIYKRDDRTRKVHHLIYVPDLEKARALRESLARIGNVASDGRPILGLDSRHLLEITLQSGEGSYLVPAHIWTPWFAVLGSKSGFDTIELCYGDLSGEIFALETGLSSDPPMNWRLSSLDRYSLVSNSDAHSPPKIGREACVFHTEMDYFAMRRALKTGESYGGTVEFFPEEGKYHFDGHRKCGVSLSPEETRRYEGLCPVCGKPLTLGVMHRVEELADRDDVPEVRPPLAAPYRSLIPLVEVLAEVQGVGPQSKAVWQKYEDLVRRLGSELFILEHASLEDVRRAASPLVAEAVSRMRAGRVLCEAGFDGQYGKIRLFTKEELRRGSSVGLLFDLSEAESTAGTAGPTETLPGDRTVGPGLPGRQQRAAAEVFFGPLLIIAGPGTGKTRTLTHRLARLISEHGVPPHECLAITFTRRAAGEMAERLEKLLPNRIDRPAAMTFHRLGLSILEEHGSRLGMAEPLRVACQTEGRQLLEEALGTSERKATRLLAQISCQKRTVQAIASSPGVSAAAPDAEIAAALDVYQQQLHARGLVDFDDLVVLPVRLLETSPDLVDHYRSRYRWVSVDEYQDIDPLQYRLVRLLVPPDGNLCVIGDPDQAIYGFRGADVSCFQRFNDDFPSARTISLVRNYRSTRTIVDASLELIEPASLITGRRLEARSQALEQIEIHECPTDRAEAEFVVHTIERLIGGSTFFSMDSGRVETHDGEALSFADFAVLYRTEAQAEPLTEAFARSGMPFQKRSHVSLADQPAVRALVDKMEALPEDQSVLERLDQAAAELRDDDPQADASLSALRLLAGRHQDNWQQFVRELALGVDVDLWDPRADRVSLLTLHAVKGLEFPVVFIVGCEDGLIPLHWGSPQESDLAEERRLLFVGMTRACRRLYVSHARKRRWHGKIRTPEVSPFLRDIRQSLLSRLRHRAAKKPPARQNQRTLFEL